jgi:predicted dithiol-disulfide oxidoreductase (DUF899 family)
MDHPVVSRDEWLAARKAQLQAEKALTKQRDEVLAARRALPWVKVEKAYVFEGPDGPVGLADLFDGRSQLFVQHFMFGPGWGEGCPACSLMADHVDAAREHFEQADLSFAAVSRAPWTEIAPFRQRMGWNFAWVSSFANDFNFDYGVSFTEAEQAAGKPLYNYNTIAPFMDEIQGVSVFARNAAGEVFHTYSAYARGVESVIGAFAFLDFAPKGRNEVTGTMDWVRHHDRYDDSTASSCHSAAQ